MTIFFPFFHILVSTRLHMCVPMCVLHHSSTSLTESGTLPQTQNSLIRLVSGASLPRDLPPLPSEARIIGRPPSPSVTCMGSGEPHTCVVDALTPEPPPQPLTGSERTPRATPTVHVVLSTLEVPRVVFKLSGLAASTYPLSQFVGPPPHFGDSVSSLDPELANWLG